MSDSPVRLSVVGANGIVARGVAALAADHPDRLRMVPYPPWLVAGPAPDVVLYDVVALHTGDGRDLERLVRETSAVVLALARTPRPDLTACALSCGADGWVSMEAEDHEIVAAIVSAAERSLVVSDEGTAPVVPGPRLPEGLSLSAREAEMLAYIVRGLRNSEIADHCFLSVNSVKTYIRGAYRKIGVSNRAQAVLWWVRQGLPLEPGAHTGESPAPFCSEVIPK